MRQPPVTSGPVFLWTGVFEALTTLPVCCCLCSNLFDRFGGAYLVQLSQVYTVKNLVSSVCICQRGSANHRSAGTLLGSGVAGAAEEAFV